MNSANLYPRLDLANVTAKRARNTYAAPILLPVLSVLKENGFVYKVDPNGRHYIQRETTWPEGGEPNLYDNDDPGTVNYNCKEHGLWGIVTDKERSQAVSELQIEIDKTDDILDALYLDREIKLVTKLLAECTNSAVGTKWDKTGNGDIVGDMIAQKTVIRNKMGIDPNTIVTTMELLDAAFESSAVKERLISRLSPGDIKTLGKAAVLADMVGIPATGVTIVSSFKNTAARNQTASYTPVWGGGSTARAVLAYVEPPRIRTQGLGLHTSFTGPNGSNGVTVEMQRNAKRKGDEIVVGLNYDQLLLNPGAAVIFTGCLTA